MSLSLATAVAFHVKLITYIDLVAGEVWAMEEILAELQELERTVNHLRRRL